MVIDPFAGSGVVGAAAKKLGRMYLLCDIADASIEHMTQRLA
jgi:DNA modification methylase